MNTTAVELNSRIENDAYIDNSVPITKADWNELWHVTDVKPSFAGFLQPHAPSDCTDSIHEDYGLDCSPNTGLPVTDEDRAIAEMLKGLPTFMMTIGGWAQDMVNEIEEK